MVAKINISISTPSPEYAQRVIKWAQELGEFDLYEPTTNPGSVWGTIGNIAFIFNLGKEFPQMEMPRCNIDLR